MYGSVVWPGFECTLQVMAGGSGAGKMRSFDPNFFSKGKKRHFPLDGEEEPMRKRPMSKFAPQSRLESVHFVSAGSGEHVGGAGAAEKENDKLPRRNAFSDDHHRQYEDAPYSGPCFEPAHGVDSWAPGGDRELDRNHPHQSSSHFMAKLQQEYTNKYKAHSSRHANSYSRPYGHEVSGYGMRSTGRDGGRQGLGCTEQDRPQDRGYGGAGIGAGVSSQPHPLDRDALLKKQRLVATLSSVFSATLWDPQYATGTEAPNYSFMLSRCIQACKTNPHYVYVNLKDIPQDNLPKNRKVPTDGYACELRCQGVYLATGYSGSKNGARDRASENAVKLLTKPVEVRVVTRRYQHTLLEDVVVCQANCPTPSLAPALWNPDNPAHSLKDSYEPDMRKHWTDLVVTDNAQDPICILNNSAASSHMKVDYDFEQLPDGSWLCRVYVQDQMVAEAAGSKKTSKHAAASEVLAKVRANQAGQRQAPSHAGDAQPPDFPGVKKKHLSELVILENSNNAVCTLNETAQFNKVTVEYKFTCLADQSWRCEVYLEGQCKGCGVGPKKLVKHIAAQEALDTLRQTQAVVKTNLPKEAPSDAISRKQILGSRLADARNEIKEDNIGNQLLRKMGWTGGGLGRHGDGIAEPIQVKEQFSREGLGLDAADRQLSKRDIEDIIRKYVASERRDELRFSADLTKEERKNIHLFSQKYHLRSKSYGQGTKRHLVVSRKVNADQLIGQLLQEGQVGRYKLIKPQPSQ
ncbi:NF-kappa-B-repressing factor [Stigmatopora argus]